MKKTYLWTLFCLILILSGCSKPAGKDSNPPISPPVAQELQWDLSSIEVDNLDFGVIKDSQVKIMTINLFNDSDNQLEEDVSLVSSDFKIIFSNCANLKAQSKCFIKVSFNALEKPQGLYSANLMIGSHLNIVFATIQTTPVIKNLAFYLNQSPISSLNFGTVEYSHSFIKSLIIENKGNKSVTGSVTLDNPNFSLVYDACSAKTLKPNEKCLVKIYFSGLGKADLVTNVIRYEDLAVNLSVQVKTFEEVAQEQSEIVFIYKDQNHQETPIDLGTLNVGAAQEFQFF